MPSQAQTNSQAMAGLPETVEQQLLSTYVPPAGAYDELYDAQRVARAPWLALLEQVERLGGAEVERRWTQSQRLIRENGIAYNAFGDADARPRPWALDPVPLLIAEAEWRGISAGLTQRAKLLELVLQDLYGPQELLRSGLLPPALVYGHPGYRIALHQTDRLPTAAPMLQYYAADLGRAPDGKWWVLADRTEAPSGVGFALENRVVTSRMLPEAFRDSQVQRLAPFFQQLQTMLRNHAPTHRHNPSIAILSQGVGHPNYFEDAYLARYLGCLLVESGDLTVRDHKVWMKTLDGLMPIDVLLRRPNSELCDPLELRGDGISGVAGLLQAERAGAVLLANRCGSGLVESPVFMAFIPRLCQALLGEPLKLPGVASWWCGEAVSLDFVLANLDRLVLKKAYRSRGEESLLVHQLQLLSREQLIELIRAAPHTFVAQEQVNRSSAPAYRNERIEPTHIALRAFAVSSSGGYSVMPGALARTTSDFGPLEASTLSGEGSKDVWIVGDEPVKAVTLLSTEQEPLELVRIGAQLPSRVADDSFWLGRHLERANAAARLVRLVATRLTSEGELSDFPELRALVRGLVEQGQIEPGYAVEPLRTLLPQVEEALPSQVLDTHRAGSLAFTIGRLYSAASQVRDRLSRDTWRIVLGINEKLLAIDSDRANLADLLNLTDELIVDLAAVGGMVVESMTRTQFYRFLDIGRRVECASQSVDLLKTCLIDCRDSSRPLLEAMLESADSLMTYRSRYRASVRLAAVLDLLVTDETNPRSIAFQIDTLERHVRKLPRTGDGATAASDREQRIALSLKHAMQMIDIVPLSDAYELGQPEPLAKLLAGIAHDLPVLASAVSLKYLAHSGLPQQLSPS
ncbi:circularly permuted type 2 ATP-grasp protein [Botrimarina hoheduenensis]|uniref:Uncharacterized protein n=1 Tax=Botrimarina hoheduenensis TaxID=2528000 RepID=A0A5C5VRI9_9BACT|nr:circularly permuted type 2 ATP-grasp protein [Botrimarina hoheduenensis]TWT40800.1 hypothetical protein Pla111_32180 [Botrimarina hoheduenensis]